MKLANGYMICEVAGSFCLLPVGQNVADCNHIFNLNETGYFLCSQLREDLTYAQLLERMAAEYEVKGEGEEMSLLRKDLDAFLGELRTCLLYTSPSPRDCS